MNSTAKILIVAALVAAVVLVIVLKQGSTSSGPPPETSPAGSVSAGPAAAANVPQEKPADVRPAALPKLIDLGADKCIPCRMMAPILEQLKKEYAGRLEVEFIDVWKNQQMARHYRIKVIPAQIFLAPDGTELYRHEGFFSKEDILAKWKELGIDLGK